MMETITLAVVAVACAVMLAKQIPAGSDRDPDLQDPSARPSRADPNADPKTVPPAEPPDPEGGEADTGLTPAARDEPEPEPVATPATLADRDAPEPPAEPTPTPEPPAEPEIVLPEWMQPEPAPAAGAPPAPPAPEPPAPAQPAPGPTFEVLPGSLGAVDADTIRGVGAIVMGELDSQATPEQRQEYETEVAQAGIGLERFVFSIASRVVGALQQVDKDTSEESAERQARGARNANAMRDEFYRVTPELQHIKDDPELEPLLWVQATGVLNELGLEDFADITAAQYAAAIQRTRRAALRMYGAGGLQPSPNPNPGGAPAPAEGDPAPAVDPGASPQPPARTASSSAGFVEPSAAGGRVPPNLQTPAVKKDPALTDFDADQEAGREDLVASRQAEEQR
jgi:hypothetical protein